MNAKVNVFDKEKIRFKIKSFDSNSLDEFVIQIVNLFKKNNIVFSGPVLMPLKIQYLTLFKPRFIHKKKSKEHFEFRTHSRLIDIPITPKLDISFLQNLILKPEIEITIQRLNYE